MEFKVLIGFIIAAMILFLLGSAIGFARGPGVLRDVLPTFFFGDNQEVEWNQQFFLDNIENLRVSSDFKFVGDDTINLYYNDNHIDVNNPEPCIFGWEAIIDGDVVNDFEVIGFTRDDVDRFPPNEKRLMQNIIPLGPEEGLRQIIRYVKANGQNIVIQVSGFRLEYAPGDLKLNDVDFIIDTINRANRESGGGSGSKEGKPTKRCKYEKEGLTPEEIVELIDLNTKITDPGLIFIELVEIDSGVFDLAENENYFYNYQNGKWVTGFGKKPPAKLNFVTSKSAGKTDHQKRINNAIAKLPPTEAIYDIIVQVSQYQNDEQRPIRFYIGGFNSKPVLTYGSGVHDAQKDTFERWTVRILNEKIEAYKNRK